LVTNDPTEQEYFMALGKNGKIVLAASAGLGLVVLSVILVAVVWYFLFPRSSVKGSFGVAKWEYMEISTKFWQMGDVSSLSCRAELPDRVITADKYVTLASNLGLGVRDKKLENSTSVLNALGQEGWELVSHTNMISDVGININVYIFKRRC
jgi:hypothetical protein